MPFKRLGSCAARFALAFGFLSAPLGFSSAARAALDPNSEVGFCAPSPEALTRFEPTLTIFRDQQNQLRMSAKDADGTESSAAPAKAKERGEARFAIEAEGMRLDVFGRRLARVDGRPYVVFDARGVAKAWGGRTRLLSCRIAADRLMPERAPGSRMAALQRKGRTRVQ